MIARVVSGPKTPFGRRVLPVALLSIRCSVTISGPVSPSASVGSRRAGTVVVLLVVLVLLLLVLVLVELDDDVVVELADGLAATVIVVVDAADVGSGSIGSPCAAAPLHAPDTSTTARIHARCAGAGVRMARPYVVGGRRWLVGR